MSLIWNDFLQLDIALIWTSGRVTPNHNLMVEALSLMEWHDTPVMGLDNCACDSLWLPTHVILE
jgi:hypothetical protein